MKQEHPTHNQHPQQRQEPPQTVQPTTPVAAPPVKSYQQAQSNPGQGFGVASIVLGVLLLWLVGLPLGIMSIMKSRKANASALLGIIGTVLNVLAIFISIILLVVGVAAFRQMQTKARSIEVNAQELKNETLAQEAKNKTYKLTQDFTSSALYWSLSTPNNWTTTALDKDGLNQFAKPGTNTLFTTLQATRDGLESNKSDLIASKAYVDEYIAAMKAKGTYLTIDSTSTIEVPFLENNDTMELYLVKMHDSTPTGGYTSWFAVRAVSDRIVALNYAGNTSDITQAEWQSLLESVSLTEI